MSNYNLNKTKFNFNLRNSLKFLNEAKNISINDAELFKNLKEIKDVIFRIEIIVNNKTKFNINL